MLLKKAVPTLNKPIRIVSLVPSITELLHFLSLNEEVYGITRFCIHPSSWYRNKIKIGGTKNLNIKKIQDLKPDLIIANKEENVQEQVDELAKDFTVWLTDVSDVSGALKMIEDIGLLTHTEAAANKLTEEIKKEFKQMGSSTNKLKTAYLIWRNPYMTVGGDTFISNIMHLSGLKNVFAMDKRYPKITVEDLKQSGCQLVLLSTEPYPFKDKHVAELQKQLPDCKIVLVDGEMFSWYGSRMLQMPEYLKTLLSSIQTT